MSHTPTLGRATDSPTSVFLYRYILKDGTVQDHTATIYVDRMAWRLRWLRWTSLFEKLRTSIRVKFSDEIGEQSGSWKGGCTGCGYDLLPDETAEHCFRRMERNRKSTAAFTLIRGSESDFLGQYRRNSHAMLAIRYSF
jgi:hypothetical protein